MPKSVVSFGNKTKITVKANVFVNKFNYIGQTSMSVFDAHGITIGKEIVFLILYII